MLTQSVDYDPATKAEIKSEYVAKSVLVVPNELGPQNKWFMFEGPVLENDRIAYRYYADHRHRFDIYGKTVNDLVMDTVSWDYHDIMDWGSDILKVGNSLGIGSPAIYYQDSLYTLSDYQQKRIEIVQDDTTTVLLRTTFTGLKVGGSVFDLVQDWKMQAGAAWSEISLRASEPLPAGMYFATGIVKHLPEIQKATSADYFYAWNWGAQSYHGEQLGMAVIAALAYGPEAIDDTLNHAYVFRHAPQAVSYRFMAAWERDVNGIKEDTAFEAFVRAAAR